MKYDKPKLYSNLPSLFTAALCCGGNSNEASLLSCKSGPEANSGCGSGAAAGDRCLSGAAASGECDSGVGLG
ncbi:MAG: hypothetical protein WCR55_11255 [Lentisphaerota bacterium]